MKRTTLAAFSFLGLLAAAGAARLSPNRTPTPSPGASREASAAGLTKPSVSDAEAELVLKSARADFERQLSTGIRLHDERNGRVAYAKKVEGYLCLYTERGSKSGERYTLHNSEGEWIVINGIAYRLDYITAEFSQLGEYAANQPDGFFNDQHLSAYERRPGPDSETQRIVERFSAERIANIYKALASPGLKKRMPVGLDLASLVPTAKGYTISKDGRLLAMETYNAQGAVIDGSKRAISPIDGALPDKKFSINPALPVVPVRSLAELQSQLRARKSELAISSVN